MNNVTQLPGTKPALPIVELVRIVKEEMPSHLEFLALKAVFVRRAYQELVDQGFSKAEALELCTKIYI